MQITSNTLYHAAPSTSARLTSTPDERPRPYASGITRALAEAHLQRFKDAKAERIRAKQLATQAKRARRHANAREVKHLRLRLKDPAWREANGIEPLKKVLRKVNENRMGQYYIPLAEGLALSADGFKSTWLRCRFSRKPHLDSITKHTLEVESAVQTLREVEVSLERAARDPQVMATRAGASIRSREIGYGLFACMPLVGTLPAGDFFYNLHKARRGKLDLVRHCPVCEGPLD
ncbi:MAG TPA: hypothetical protein VFH51_18420 [Myxococcota bacterium]|nr:hypothetical protein [Myxococcota bacterium]